MASAPRILTFNFHEPYLCLMAKTGLAMDVGQYESGFLGRCWREDFREQPENLTLVGEAEWRERLNAGYYDVVIAQNEMNAVDVVRAPAAKLLVCHNRRTFLQTTASTQNGDPVAAFEELLASLRQHFAFIFISESKRDDYGIDGRVILPGIDLDDWGGYRGDDERVLRVGNTLRERDLMFDVDFQERVLHGLPNRVVGDNPSMPESAPAPTFEALRDAYRRHRCMLHVSREAYEDGYNLSMLEAMATGMPVVALANKTSPITDGVDGFTSYDADVLRARIEELLNHPDLAQRIGARGRETVGEKFPIERFVDQWKEAIFSAADKRPGIRKRRKRQPEEKRRVLVQYMASPFTTGRYFDQALREKNDVRSVGFRLPEEMLTSWGFDDNIPPYEPLDIDVAFRTSYGEIFSKTADFNPDLLLYIDTSDKELAPGFEQAPCPTAAYLIDTHVQLEPRLRMAERFDVVFIAQRAQLEAFRSRGIREVHWLPLACWPLLHDVAARERTLDFAYVGSLNKEEGPRRYELLTALAARYPKSFVGRQWPAEMAETYASAKIVVNVCVNRDVNMRVFEGLASGALVITDEADGLEDLFTDREHLVIYRRDEDLPGLIAYYLEHDEERLRIAQAGRRLVLAQHTYSDRIETLLKTVDEALERQPDDELLPKSRAYYECPRREILPFLPLHTRRVLDVGCGAGALGLVMKEESGVEEVRGIEIVPAAYEAARHVLDEVLLGNIEEMELPFQDDYFDAIICADVLEHLVDPAAALRKLSRVLAPDGAIIISIPNIQYHEILTMLSNGAWTYMEAGLMDSTHLRFFTKPTVRRMIEQAGMEVGRLQPLNARPEDYIPMLEGRALQMGKLRVENLSDEQYECFRVYQWAAVAVKPNVDRLARVREVLAQGRFEAAYVLAENALGVDEQERTRLMARALAKLGKLEDAERLYMQALGMAPSTEIEGELGLLLIGMNRSDEGKPYLDRAIASHPNNERFRGIRGVIAWIEEGDAQTAYDDLQFTLDSNFEHKTLLDTYIAAARALGRLRDTEELVRRFADFYPGDVEVAVVHAELLLELDDTRAARERLDTIALFAAGDERVQTLLAQLDQKERGA